MDTKDTKEKQLVKFIKTKQSLKHRLLNYDEPYDNTKWISAYRRKKKKKKMAKRRAYYRKIQKGDYSALYTIGAQLGAQLASNLINKKF